MAVTPPGTRLGCGRDIDDVWANVGHPPTPHEATCPYCQAARADLAGLARATRALHEEDAALETSPAVVDRILGIARAEVRRGRRLPLDRPADGRTSDLTVSEQAVATVVRRTGDRSPQVQVRRCTVALVGPDEAGGDAPGGPGGPATVRVALRVSVAASAAIPEVVERLRAAVIGTVADEVGLVVLRVDVAVEDVHGA